MSHPMTTVNSILSCSKIDNNPIGAKVHQSKQLWSTAKSKTAMEPKLAPLTSYIEDSLFRQGFKEKLVRAAGKDCYERLAKLQVVNFDYTQEVKDFINTYSNPIKGQYRWQRFG